MNNIITIRDAFIVPFLLIVAFFVSARVQSKNIDDKPYYKYFTAGLFVKIFSGIALVLIYTFYYGMGDTHYYYFGTQSIINMFGKDVPTFIQLLLGERSAEIGNMFDATTGYPTYFRDAHSFAVCRFNTLFYILGGGSFLGNTIIMDLLLYVGIWNFYKMLVNFYPNSSKYLAYGLFFIPSVVFWSSGVLKDGWTLVAFLCFFVNIWRIFFKREDILLNGIKLLFWGYVALSIRPYIFYVSLFSSFIWVGLGFIKQIQGNFIRFILFPIICIMFVLIGGVVFTKISSQESSRYKDIDSILETAYIIQNDLKKDYYGGNSFDIGEFEPTISGVLKKSPQAVTAGLFRPFLWESRNVLMLMSGLENFLLLLLSLFIIIKGRLKIVKYLYDDSFLLVLFISSVTFAFFVGLTTANFGALVRYTIISKILFVILLLQILYLERHTDEDVKLDSSI